MTISIDDINRTLVSSSNQSSATAKDQPRTDKDQAAASRGDTVALTESAKLIQQLEKQLESVPVVDADRVAEVRENLNSGNYSISTSRVAEKFSLYESFLQQAS